MKSMRRQLILALLIGILLITGIVGAGLYIYVQRELTFQFDNVLSAKARAVAATVHLTQNDIEMSDPPETMAEFSRERRRAYFEIWNPDGSVFKRSKSLGDGDLSYQSAGNRPVFGDAPLPDQRNGRLVYLRFIPEPADEDDAPEGYVHGAGPRMILAVAQEREALDDPLGVILGSLVGGAALISLGVIFLVAATVRRSLAPLARVTEEASRINADSLEYRFAADQMPAELAPICHRLNDLLERLGAAFARERRFTSDVAHELRTPIAELRSLAEVSLRWPGDAAATQTGFGDALGIARHMERMVTTLLALSRCESGKQTATSSAVDLHQIVNDAARPLEADAAGRKLQFEFQFPDQAFVRSDPALLASIVSNLLSNAVQYSKPDSTIVCGAKRNAGNITLTISNATDTLAAADLPHMMEPFWRKDAARSPDDHSGLGLALVKAYADVLRAPIKTSLTGGNLFSMEIELPGEAPPVSPQLTPWQSSGQSISSGKAD
jgi:two-component system sensor histidine kinase QseC